MNAFLNNMDVVLLHIGNVTLTLGGLIASVLVLTFGYWLARKLRFLIHRIIGPRFRIERNTAFALGLQGIANNFVSGLLLLFDSSILMVRFYDGVSFIFGYARQHG